MTSCWVNYHVFLARLDGRTYRCSPTLDDAAFDRRMDALCWRMPYHLRAFHTSDPKWAAENPVLAAARTCRWILTACCPPRLPSPCG